MLKLGHLTWAIAKFSGEKFTESVYQKVVPDPFLILVNSPKQLMHASNSFENKTFWKRIIKKAYKA